MATVSPPVGGFPGLCLDNHRAREYAEAFIKEVATRYTESPAVKVYDLWNEPHIEGVRDHWAWPYFERKVFCYCDGSGGRFKEWLRRKYSSLEGLNEAWRRRYSSWEQVQPPIRRGNLVDWLDWRTFWLENLAEVLGWMVRTFRKYNSTQKVMTHSGGNGSLYLGLYGCDDWQMAPKVDLYGVSLWGTGDYSQICAGLDGIRCAARGKEYWVSECYFAPATGV